MQTWFNPMKKMSKQDVLDELLPSAIPKAAKLYWRFSMSKRNKQGV
jgi:hypothetical protein